MSDTTPGQQAAAVPASNAGGGLRMAMLAVVVAVGVLWVGRVWWRSTQAGVAHDAVGWLTDLDEAGRVATESNKPVLVKFTADWCGPCKSMSRHVLSDAGVGRFIRGGFVPVIVDITAPGPGQRLADAYGVAVLPTLMVLDAQLREIARKGGYLDKTGLIAWLDPMRNAADHASTDRIPVADSHQ